MVYYPHYRITIQFARRLNRQLNTRPVFRILQSRPFLYFSQAFPLPNWHKVGARNFSRMSVFCNQSLNSLVTISKLIDVPILIRITTLYYVTWRSRCHHLMGIYPLVRHRSPNNTYIRFLWIDIRNSEKPQIKLKVHYIWISSTKIVHSY